MSALQQSSQTYQRAQIPNITLPLRRGDISNVERLDAQRAKKLHASIVKKKLEDDLEKIKELEVYYSMRRNSISKNVSPRRKLDTSMVSVLFPSDGIAAPEHAKKGAEKTKKSLFKKSSKKRKVTVDDETAKQNEAYKKQKLSKIKSTFSAVVTIALVFVMLSTVLVRYAEISNQTYLNAQTEKEIQNLETEISKLDMDRALKEDLTSVQYAAASKGMTRPADEQVVFMSVNPELPDKYTANEKSDMSNEDINQNYSVSADDADAVNPAESEAGPLEVFNSFFGRIGETLQGWFS